MDIVKLRKELDYLYSEISKSRFAGNHEVKEALFRLIKFNQLLLTELVTDKLNKDESNVFVKDELEKHFINGVKEIINDGTTLNTDILNWYRNLYYKEDGNTERGIMAHVINNIFGELTAKGINLTGLYSSPIK